MFFIHMKAVGYCSVVRCNLTCYLLITGIVYHNLVASVFMLRQEHVLIPMNIQSHIIHTLTLMLIACIPATYLSHSHPHNYLTDHLCNFNIKAASQWGCQTHLQSWCWHQLTGLPLQLSLLLSHRRIWTCVLMNTVRIMVIWSHWDRGKAKHCCRRMMKSG